MKIILTKDHLMMGISRSGGWNAKQFQILGIKWPPKRGWMKTLIGRSVDRDVFRDFLESKTDRHRDFVDKNPFGANSNTSRRGYGSPKRRWDTKNS